MSLLASSIDSATASGWGVAVAAFAMAVFERLKSSKTVKKTEAETETLSLARASQTRAEMMQEIADDYKELLEKERAEHKATRDFWHEENGKNQKLLSEANLKVMELQDRPDYREILAVLKAQGDAIKEILLLLSNQHK